MLLRSSSAPIVGSCFYHQTDSAKENEYECFSALPHKILAQPTPFYPCPSPVSVCCASHEFQESSCSHESRRGSCDFEKELFSLARMRKTHSEGDLASLSHGVANRSAASSLMNAAADESEAAIQNCSSLQRQWMKRVSSCGRGLAFDRNDAIREEFELSDSGEEEEGAQITAPADTSVASSNATRNLVDLEEEDGTAPAVQISLSTPVLASGTHVQGFLLEDGECYTSVSASPSGQLLVCNSKGCRPVTESEKLNPLFMASALELGMSGGSGGKDSSRGQNGDYGGDSNRTEEHYKNLLQVDSENPLFLRNYAQYLSETKREHKKAEEYFERAILACSSDGDVLSKYAKHVWDVHNDHDRAELYYDRAIKAAPEDSHVMASYASFLWDSEDEGAEPSAPPERPALHGVSSGTPRMVLSV